MASVNKCRRSSGTLSFIKQVVSCLPNSDIRSKWFEAIASDHSTLPSSLDVSHYDDWRSFASDYLIVELLSKFDGLNLSINREAVAIEKFLAAEETCRLANRRFANLERTQFNFADPRLSILHGARRKIEKLLSSFNWDEALPLMGFGPGASIGIRRRKSHPVNKIGHPRPTSTGECAALGPALFKALPQWLKAIAPSGAVCPEFDICSGNRVTTVPKNSKTDRVIAIEPLLNMFVQKGIGGIIRRRLKRVGVDLDDQTRNQQLALAGSKVGHLATVDLSAASDSIALGLVEWLLPPDWVMAMKICRSPVGVLPDGRVIRYQKVSSMGNGFTFELESLIFWAVSSEVVASCGGDRRDIAVYGDDIVVPVGCVPLLFDVFSFMGFTPNEKKTHFTGPFRESCGKHYFAGREVTPFYVKVDVDTVQRKLWLANSVRRWAARYSGLSYGCAGSLSPAYYSITRSLPRWARRLSIPDGFGDGGLVRCFDEARPSRHRSFDAYVTNHLVRSFTGRLADGQAALCYSLMKLERLSSYHAGPSVLAGLECYTGLRPEGVDIGEIPCRYRDKVISLIVPQWEGPGPWVDGL